MTSAPSSVDRRELRAFVEDALERYGALVERGLRRSEAVLPSALASALQRDESVVITEESEELGTAELLCTLGAPSVEWLLNDLRREPVLVADQPDVAAPRANQARALAERVTFRNAVAVVGESRASTATYLHAIAAWVAEADDRFEGVVSVARNLQDGAHCAERYVERLPPGPALSEVPAIDPRIASEVHAHLSRSLHGAIAPIEAGIARRKEQEAARTIEYFAALWADLDNTRRKADSKALAAKRAAIVAERDAKLREIPGRYALRVKSRWVYARVCVVPAMLTELVVKRRKSERRVLSRLAAEAASLDVWACESCGGPAPRAAVCDERLHIVCEPCAPTAQGRWDCPACGRGA